MSNPYGAVAMSTPSTDSRDVLFGVALPAGAATWLASYIRKDDRSVLNRDAHQIAVGLSYRLSPRTDVYSSFAKIRNSNGGAYTIFYTGDTPHGDRSINIGLRHAF
jgi:predicted porin